MAHQVMTLATKSSDLDLMPEITKKEVPKFCKLSYVPKHIDNNEQINVKTLRD